jgi:hypothetical protein
MKFHHGYYGFGLVETKEETKMTRTETLIFGLMMFLGIAWLVYIFILIKNKIKETKRINKIKKEMEHK